MIVGPETLDDAAVYRISDDKAIVVTADIITPPVDDPFVFGQIAAANALSDIYAMGAEPILALNLLGFPEGQLPADTMRGIIAGASERLQAGRVLLGGGHTTRDDEPKFGLAVVGQVHPKEVWSNAEARIGDALILTKPIGTGVLLNAHVRGKLHEDDLSPVLDIMIELNRRAAKVFRDFEVHAATDVTGFGLLGHATELAQGSEVTVRLRYSDIPFFPGAKESYERGITTAVNLANGANTAATTDYRVDLSDAERELLIDPQTSGGLLVALPADQAQPALEALTNVGVDLATVVGSVAACDESRFVIVE